MRSASPEPLRELDAWPRRCKERAGCGARPSPWASWAPSPPADLRGQMLRLRPRPRLRLRLRPRALPSSRSAARRTRRGPSRARSTGRRGCAPAASTRLTRVSCAERPPRASTRPSCVISPTPWRPSGGATPRRAPCSRASPVASRRARSSSFASMPEGRWPASFSPTPGSSTLRRTRPTPRLQRRRRRPRRGRLPPGRSRASSAPLRHPRPCPSPGPRVGPLPPWQPAKRAQTRLGVVSSLL